MKYTQILFAFFLLNILGAGGAEVTAQKSKKSNQKATTKKVVAKKTTAKPVAKIVISDDAFKTLAQGDQSSVEEPFIFIARNAETYAQLQTKVESLPAAESIDFQKTAVVAAFAGTRATPGYRITFEKIPNSSRMKINLIEPPKDVMLAQVLTAPFRVIAIPIESESSLEIEPSPIWQLKAQVYRITTGTFEYSGGLTGKSEEFKPIGSIKLWQAGDLVTAIFNLNAFGTRKARLLTDIASGSLASNKINLSRIDPGQFVEMPHPALKADGIMDEKKLTLNFASLPTTVADGFAGKGKIEAVR
jgi:hypothetical protein